MFDNGTEDVRFYKEKFPQPGDCVVVIVGKVHLIPSQSRLYIRCCYGFPVLIFILKKKSTKDGVRVKLLEYGHIDGFIRKEDIDRCKETFVLLIARKGKNEVVKVLSVNAETGSCIFLSYWLFDSSTDLYNSFYRLYRAIEASSHRRRAQNVR